MTLGYILGGALVVVGGLVSTIRFCIPSMVFRAVFGYPEKGTSHQRQKRLQHKGPDITARAFGRDPSFYEFFKSMETLKASMGKDSTVILSTDSDLLRFIQGAKR